MFYRRKIILALLQQFGGKLEKIRLQKLLFLFAQKQAKPEYDFIPFKFGCYSYSVNADLTTMVKKNLLAETDKHFAVQVKTKYLNQLKELDHKQLLEVQSAFSGMSAKALMKYTYLHYPYYAVRSEVAEELLSSKEFEAVKKSIPENTKTILFSIGYEGISLEEYLNRLLRNDIKILVDVRNNPLSMKYGFSKNQLKRFCESVGIQYSHFPEVGIQSNQRQHLNSQNDYDALFETYRNENLIKTVNTQTKILNLLKQHKRIALTCFEANINQCHRKHLTEAITRLPGFEFEVQHL